MFQSEADAQRAKHESNQSEERLQIAHAKLVALEQYTNDLQVKYDRLEAKFFEKEA